MASAIAIPVEKLWAS